MSQIKYVMCKGLDYCFPKSITEISKLWNMGYRIFEVKKVYDKLIREHSFINDYFTLFKR